MLSRLGGELTVPKKWLPAGLLVPPLLLTWLGSCGQNASAYVAYLQVMGLRQPMSHALLARSPLSFAIFKSLDWLGLPLEPVGLAASVLGWGMAAWVLYCFLDKLLAGRSTVAILPALMFALSPVMLGLTGTMVPWIIALGTWSMLLNKPGARGKQSVILGLLLGLDFSVGTVALIAVGWILQRKRPTRSNLPWVILGLLSLAWFLFAQYWLGVFPFELDPDWADLRQELVQLFYESDLYWVFGWLMAVGVGVLFRKGQAQVWIAGLVWAGLTAWQNIQLAMGVLNWLLLALVAVGIDWLLDSFGQRQEKWPIGTLRWGGVLFMGTVLLLAQCSSLWFRYQICPQDFLQTEQEAAAWLQAYSQPSELVVASAQVGFWAERPTWVWSGELSEELGDLAADFYIAGPSIYWDQLLRQTWFQDSYEPVKSFVGQWPAASRVAWARRSTPWHQVEMQPVWVETGIGANLTAFGVWPATVESGGAVYVTLEWTAAQAVQEAFNTVLAVSSPIDGLAWAQVERVTPSVLTPGWWWPDQTITERYVLTTTADIPVGAYRLDLSVREPETHVAMALRQNHDSNRVDRVTLDYLAVPWAGELSPTAKAVGAVFGDQIRLESFAVEGQLQPGEQMTVSLYWNPLRRPEADYTVFVHLIDGDGKMLTGHDDRPMAGRYSTLAWQAGVVVADEHPLSLPAEMTAGPYYLRVGLYLPESGERLLVGEGESQSESYVLLPIER